MLFNSLHFVFFFILTTAVYFLLPQRYRWAFLLLISERQARNPVASWAEFEAANPDLLVWKPSILARYYSKELLASDLARRTFVMPDLI